MLVCTDFVTITHQYVSPNYYNYLIYYYRNLLYDKIYKLIIAPINFLDQITSIQEAIIINNSSGSIFIKMQQQKTATHIQQDEKVQTKLQVSSGQQNNHQIGSSLKQFFSHDHDYLAYGLQIFACLVWTCSYIYTNEKSFNSFETVMVKGVIGTILNYLVLLYRGFNIKFEQPRIFRGLLLINMCVMTYLLALPICQLYLPLPIVHTIGCSSIALVYIMDYFIHGTKITKNGLIGVVMAFLGVMLMTNNRLLMSLVNDNYKFDSTFGNYRSQSILVISLFALILFLSRIFQSYGIVTLKDYPQISVFELNYHNNIICTFIGGIGYMLRTDNKKMEVFWPSIITIGVGQFICFTAFFYSLKITKKIGNVMLMNGFNIVIAFVISYFRYGEALNFILLLGGISLFISMTIVIVQTINSKKATVAKINTNQVQKKS